MALQRALWLLVTFPLLSLAVIWPDINRIYLPKDSTVIGFRKVHSTSVNTFRSFKNQPLWNMDTQEDGRYGPGIYLTGDAETAFAANNTGLPCVFFAKAPQIKSAIKVKIPKKMTFFVDDDDVPHRDSEKVTVEAGNSRYDMDRFLSWREGRVDGDFRKAIRVANPDDYLIVIPPKQMNHNGGKLGLKVLCRDNVEELKEAGITSHMLSNIDYTGDDSIWQNNLEGDDRDWDTWDPTRFV